MIKNEQTKKLVYMICDRYVLPLNQIDLERKGRTSIGRTIQHVENF